MPPIGTPRTLAGLLAAMLSGACGESRPDLPAPFLWPRAEFPAPSGPIFDEAPWLSDVSSWAAPGCGAGQPRDAGHMGDFGVGNDSVFALAGYACPLAWSRSTTVRLSRAPH